MRAKLLWALLAAAAFVGIGWWLFDPATRPLVEAARPPSPASGVGRSEGEGGAIEAARAPVDGAPATDLASADLDLKESPTGDTTYQSWWGRPTGAFLTSYWGIRPDELAAEFEILGHHAERIALQPIPSHFASWETALPALKEEARVAIQNGAGERSWAVVQGLGIGESRLGGALEALARDIAPARAAAGSEFLAALREELAVVEPLQASVVEAQVALAHQLLDAGNVDRFPLHTVKSGRGVQRPAVADASSYRYVNVEAYGWLAQFELYEGDSPRLDHLTRDFRYAAHDALLRSVEGRLGVQLSAAEVDRIGVRKVIR